YQYSLKLLEYLTKGKRIYLYDRDFVAGDDLYIMIKTISFLDEGKLSLAEECWKKLSLLSPDTYLENFEYKGDKCLFSLCLDKCLQKTNPNEIVLNENYSAQEKAFVEFFRKYNFLPQLKEELFEGIYGRMYNDKKDLASL